MKIKASIAKDEYDFDTGVIKDYCLKWLYIDVVAQGAPSSDAAADVIDMRCRKIGRYYKAEVVGPPDEYEGYYCDSIAVNRAANADQQHRCLNRVLWYTQFRKMKA